MDAGTVETTYLVNIGKALANVATFTAALSKSVQTAQQTVSTMGKTVDSFNANPIANANFVAKTVEGFNKVGTAVTGFHAKLIESISGTKGAIDGITAQIGTLQGVLATIGSAGFFEAAREFDRAATNLRADLGQTEKQFASTREEIVRFSREMSVAATTSAEALTRLARSGFAGKEAFDVLKAGVIGAKATLGDVTQTTDTLGRVLRGFNLPVQDAKIVMDQLRVAGISARVDLESLGVAVAKLGPQAKLSGVSFTELLQILTLIVRNGGNAESSIGQLRQAMAGLRNPPKEAANAIKEYLGVTAQASIQNIGFAETLRLLIQRTGGTAEALTKVFPSIREFDALASLATASADEMNDVFKKISGAGATDLQRAMEAQKSSISGLTSSIGKLIAAPVIEFFERHTAAIKANLGALKDFLKEHQDLVKGVISFGIALTGIVTTLFVFKTALIGVGAVLNIAAQLSVTVAKGAQLMAAGFLSAVEAGQSLNKVFQGLSQAVKSSGVGFAIGGADLTGATAQQQGFAKAVEESAAAQTEQASAAQGTVVAQREELASTTALTDAILSQVVALQTNTAALLEYAQAAGGAATATEAQVVVDAELAAVAAADTAALTAEAIAERELALETLLATQAQVAQTGASVASAAAAAGSASVFAKLGALLPTLTAPIRSLSVAIVAGGGIVPVLGAMAGAVGGAITGFAALAATLAGIVAVAGVVAFAFYKIGNGVEFLLEKLGILKATSTGEENRVAALEKSYSKLNERLHETNTVLESVSKAEQLKVLYDRLTDAAINFAHGNKLAGDQVRELRAEIEKLGGTGNIAKKLAEDVDKASSVFKAGAVAATTAGNQNGAVDAGGNAARFDLGRIQGLINTGQEKNINVAKELLNELAIRAGTAQEKVGKLVDEFVRATQAQNELSVAFKRSQSAQQGNIQSLGGVDQFLKGTVDNYQKLDEGVVKLLDDLEAANDGLGNVKGLEKQRAKLVEMFNDIEKAKQKAIEFAGGENKLSPSQEKSIQDLKAIQQRIIEAVNATDTQIDKIDNARVDRRKQLAESLDDAIEQGEIRSLERQHRFAEAETKASDLRLKQRLAEIDRIKNAEGETDQETEDRKEKLRVQAKADHQAELDDVDKIAKKKFEATDEGEKQREAAEKKKREDLKLDEALVLQEQLTQAQKLGDIRTELTLRAKLEQVLKDIGDVQAQNALKDQAAKKSAIERIALLREELATQARLGAKPGEFSDTIRSAQRDLAGSSDPISFRAGVRDKFGGLNSDDAIKQRTEDITTTLKTEFFDQQNKEAEAIRTKNKDAAAEANKAMKDVAEKYRILLEEQIRAINELKAVQANPGATEKPGEHRVVGPQAPATQSQVTGPPSPADIAAQDKSARAAFNSRFVDQGDKGFFDKKNKVFVSKEDAQNAVGVVPQTETPPTSVDPYTPYNPDEPTGTESQSAPIISNPSSPASTPSSSGANTAILDAVNGAVGAVNGLSVAITGNSDAVKQAMGTMKLKFEQVTGQLNVNTRAIKEQERAIQSLRIEGRS